MNLLRQTNRETLLSDALKNEMWSELEMKYSLSSLEPANIIGGLIINTSNLPFIRGTISQISLLYPKDASESELVTLLRVCYRNVRHRTNIINLNSTGGGGGGISFKHKKPRRWPGGRFFILLVS